tara:strand:- start:1038 stop:1364 length:327 start_codon:yes stop_codon:yes gene_type:complete
MQDWVELLIAFMLGFFVKHLLGTVCNSRLIEGVRERELVAGDTVGDDCNEDNDCRNGMICSLGVGARRGACFHPNVGLLGGGCNDDRRCKSNYCNPDTMRCDDPIMRG